MLVDSSDVLEMFCIDCEAVQECEAEPCKHCEYKRRIESAQEQHQQWSRDSPEDTDKSIVREI